MTTSPSMTVRKLSGTIRLKSCAKLLFPTRGEPKLYMLILMTPKGLGFAGSSVTGDNAGDIMRRCCGQREKEEGGGVIGEGVIGSSGGDVKTLPSSKEMCRPFFSIRFADVKGRGIGSVREEVGAGMSTCGDDDLNFSATRGCKREGLAVTLPVVNCSP